MFGFRNVINQLRNLISLGYIPELIICRGIPGTGKTTRAYRLTNYVASIDHYPDRYLPNGKINPDIPDHVVQDWCRQLIIGWMKQKISKIAVDSPLIKRKYVQEWLDLAARYGYRVCIIDCTIEYGSVHPVSEETMNLMRQEWEPWK